MSGGTCCSAGPKPSAAHPVIIGPDTGPVRYVRPTVGVIGLRVGEPVYVRGGHVQTMIDARWLTELPLPA